MLFLLICVIGGFSGGILGMKQGFRERSENKKLSVSGKKIQLSVNPSSSTTPNENILSGISIFTIGVLFYIMSLVEYTDPIVPPGPGVVIFFIFGVFFSCAGIVKIKQGFRKRSENKNFQRYIRNLLQRHGHTNSGSLSEN